MQDAPIRQRAAGSTSNLKSTTHVSRMRCLACLSFHLFSVLAVEVCPSFVVPQTTTLVAQNGALDGVVYQQNDTVPVSSWGDDYVFSCVYPWQAFPPTNRVTCTGGVWTAMTPCIC